VTFGSAALEGQRTVLPSLTLAMNSRHPSEAQRPHRHNAVAVTLVVEATRGGLYYHCRTMGFSYA
jgi:gentisate 1,2-dioxygenase